MGQGRWCQGEGHEPQGGGEGRWRGDSWPRWTGGVWGSLGDWRELVQEQSALFKSGLAAAENHTHSRPRPEPSAALGRATSPTVLVNVSCRPTGKVVIEEEMKEEMKEDVDPHNGADDGEWGAPLTLPWALRAAPHPQPGCPVGLRPELPCPLLPSLGREPHVAAWAAHTTNKPRGGLGSSTSQVDGKRALRAQAQLREAGTVGGRAGSWGPRPQGGASSAGPSSLQAPRQPQLRVACV